VCLDIQNVINHRTLFDPNLYNSTVVLEVLAIGAVVIINRREVGFDFGIPNEKAIL
jgi:hypothetical protein